jgi:hypothetical protein
MYISESELPPNGGKTISKQSTFWEEEEHKHQHGAWGSTLSERMVISGAPYTCFDLSPETRAYQRAIELTIDPVQMGVLRLTDAALVVASPLLPQLLAEQPVADCVCQAAAESIVEFVIEGCSLSDFKL